MGACPNQRPVSTGQVIIFFSPLVGLFDPWVYFSSHASRNKIVRYMSAAVWKIVEVMLLLVNLARVEGRIMMLQIFFLFVWYPFMGVCSTPFLFLLETYQVFCSASRRGLLGGDKVVAVGRWRCGLDSTRRILLLFQVLVSEKQKMLGICPGQMSLAWF